MPSCTVEGGHGRETLGKGSPDGVFKEWAWTRDTADIFAQTLNAKGITCTNVVPEENDITLAERCKRINWITQARKDNVHVSMHVNAAGNGKSWMSPRGVQVHTYTKPSEKSVRLANLFYDEGLAKGFKMRPESPSMHYRPKNLAILRETDCPAILIEFFFMDNKEDLAYLLSPTSCYECAEVAANAVLKYFGKI